MFPPLLGLGLDEGVSIESMEGWMVVYFSKDGHDACGWMMVEGGIRGKCASLPSALLLRVLYPASVLGQLKCS